MGGPTHNCVITPSWLQEAYVVRGKATSRFLLHADVLYIRSEYGQILQVLTSFYQH
jgi:hypothetical protein